MQFRVPELFVDEGRQSSMASSVTGSSWWAGAKRNRDPRVLATMTTGLAGWNEEITAKFRHREVGNSLLGSN